MTIKPSKKLTTLACAGILAFTLAGCSSATATSADGANGITVTASSETKIVPDKARVNIAVVTEGQTADACQQANAESVNQVIEALSGLGVTDESIQTSYSDLSPRYGSRVSEGNGKTVEVDDASYDEWVITGYEMNTSLQVSDLDIDNVGTVVQACIAAGANSTNGVEYYASDYDEAYNEALAEALASAKAKAEGIADATGANLGKAVNVTEGYQDTSARYVSSLNSLAMEEADDVAAAKTMPGQVSISANVTVTYAIS